MKEMIKEILKDFRGFMKNAYTVAWDIIGVGGREDIINTLGSLIECNYELGKPKIQIIPPVFITEQKRKRGITSVDKICATVSREECNKHWHCFDCPADDRIILPTPTQAVLSGNGLKELGKSDVEIIRGLKPNKYGKLIIYGTKKVQDERLDILNELLGEKDKKINIIEA